MERRALQFIARRCAAPAEFRLAMRPVGGGLESAVVRAMIKGGSAAGARPLPRRFMIKELRGTQRREAAVYQEIWPNEKDPPVARLLGADCSGEAHYLYLEEVRATSSWPWADPETAAEVCRVLARLHASPRPTSPVFLDWNYEAELAQSARDTLALARHARDPAGVRLWKRVGDLTRVVGALPQLRKRLLGDDTTVVHGDMHPGNVIVRRGRRKNRIAIIDWARARAGSPWEDVASWLHSLGCWEPRARQRHDTLLRHYLEARGGEQPAAVTPELRLQYWFASASNGLSGAIRYHLAVAANPASTDQLRSSSLWALHAWGRAIRQAATLLPPAHLVEADERVG